MNQELKRHLRRLTIYTWGLFLSSLFSVFSGAFCLLLLFFVPIGTLYLLPFFLILLFLALLFWHKGKAYSRRDFETVCFTLSEPYSYDDVLEEFATSAGEEYTLKCSEDAVFFKLGRNPVTRTLVLRMNDFEKHLFKQMKNSANRKVSHVYQDTPWTGSTATNRYPQRIYLNIIYADSLTENLQAHIKKNALDALSHGSLNAIICPDSIFLPPLYGIPNLYALSAYKTAIIIFRSIFSIA